jgi:cytochrome c oxidase cbb3-type subunit IV
MDMDFLRSVVTVLSMCMFVGIVVWVFARGNKAQFEEAAQLPFAEDGLEAHNE